MEERTMKGRWIMTPQENHSWQHQARRSADRWSFFPLIERVGVEQQQERFWQEVEGICVHEETTHLDFALEPRSFFRGARVLDQRVLLQRRTTGEPLLFVAALLALDALPADLARRMQAEEQARPAHWLFSAPDLEQAVLSEELQPAGHLLCRYLALDSHVLCPARTILYTHAVPVLLTHVLLIPPGSCQPGGGGSKGASHA